MLLINCGKKNLEAYKTKTYLFVNPAEKISLDKIRESVNKLTFSLQCHLNLSLKNKLRSITDNLNYIQQELEFMQCKLNDIFKNELYRLVQSKFYFVY